MSHNPNPFDFVPFAKDTPQLKTIEEWRREGELVTGSLEIKLRALTPLHIVGRQETMGENTNRIQKSHFYRRRGQSLIPAASIRGMIRAFLEAACNGWVSQATPYHLQEKGKRHVGFMATKASEELRNSNKLNKVSQDLQSKTAIPEHLLPSNPDNFEDIMQVRMDLSCFLFGMIDPTAGGWQGRIRIEDAPVPSVTWKDGAFPDIADTAFMGGGKPSASSWWYQHPCGVRRRKVKPKNGNPFYLPEFLGLTFRGRKFYYHQSPSECLSWYGNAYNWPEDSKRKFYTFPAECLPENSESESFFIYFEDVPKPLIHLLILILCPGPTIRHKLGYGKAYGAGSIEFEFLGGRLRGAEDWNPLTEVQKIHSVLWKQQKLENFGIGHYLHWESLEHLARILWWEPGKPIVFTYPRFNAGYQINDTNGRWFEQSKLAPQMVEAFRSLRGQNPCMANDLENAFLAKMGRLRSGSESQQGKKLIREHACVVEPHFLPPVRENQLKEHLTPSEKEEWQRFGQIVISEPRAAELAHALCQSGLRPALHFEVYQRAAQGYETIQNRHLVDAEKGQTAEVIHERNT